MLEIVLYALAAVLGGEDAAKSEVVKSFLFLLTFCKQNKYIFQCWWDNSQTSHFCIL